MLKGPGALLNGMPPANGGVGGTVNLVTKRAGDEPFAQMTNTFSSRSQFGTNVDVSRRFGEDKEFGLRFNGTYRDGATELANQSQELGSASRAWTTVASGCGCRPTTAMSEQHRRDDAVCRPRSD